MADGAAFWMSTLSRFLLMGLFLPADTYGIAYNTLIITECTIKVDEQSSGGKASVVRSYNCDGIEVFEASQSTKTSFEWSNSSFGLTYPIDACSPVDPIVPRNETHIALVETYICGELQDCTYALKADNVGSSGYVAFITWDAGCRQSGKASIPDSAVDSASGFGNLSALAISVSRPTGLALVGYANSSSYVIDVNITLWKFGDLLLLFVGVFFGITVIICCCFCGIYGLRVCITRERRSTMSNRTLRRMTAKRKYRAGASLNDTCSICLEDFSEGEVVRELPCKHVYHQVCVDVWLKHYKAMCPNCKTSIRAKKRALRRSTSEEGPLLAARDDGDETAAVDYGSTTRREGQEEEDTLTDQTRLTTNEPAESEEESDHHHLVYLSVSSDEPSRTPPVE